MPLPSIPSRREQPKEVPVQQEEYSASLPEIEVEEDYPALPSLPTAPHVSAPSVAPAARSFLPTTLPSFAIDKEDDDALDLPVLPPSSYVEEAADDFGYDDSNPVFADPAVAPGESTFYEAEEEGSALDDAAKSLSPEIQDSVERLLMHINDQESSEVLMNGPSEIMIKVNGARFHVSTIDFKTIKIYHDVINNFVLPFVDTNERLGDNSYLIEGQMELPDMEDPDLPPTIARVHIIAPPVVKAAKVTIAKKARRQFTVDDIVANGAMSYQMGEFLKVAARGKLTTILSGLSGSGKTTLLEAMSHHFDQDDRILVVEDTQELMLPISDVVYMRSQLARPGDKDIAPITLEWLVSQANRMRPDRIIIGEVRGGEMSEFLVAANSGADGSMTTIHAGSPKLTLTKIASLAMKNVTSKNEDSIVRDIAATIQIVVQAALIDGQHVITHIEEISDIVNQTTKAISTQTLFEYNRNTGKHVAISRPSEKLQSFLAQRGIKLDPQLFVNR